MSGNASPMRTTAIMLGLAITASGVAVLAQDGEPDGARDAAWHNAQQTALWSRSASDGWQVMDGGLRWRRVEGDGSGPHPTVADTVTVHYAGTFPDGSSFDSSYERNEPATFPLGQLIPAWQMTIPQMGIGDKIELAAPATVAYGLEGRGPIPGGATLLFTVELLGIEGQ